MLFLEAIKTSALEEGRIIAPCDKTSKIVNLYFKNVDGETHMFLYDNDDMIDRLSNLHVNITLKSNIIKQYQSLLKK